MSPTPANVLRGGVLFAVAGIAVLIATGVGGFRNPPQFFFSWLYAVLFWLGLSLGCLAVTMIHLLAGGRWGYPTRRFLEAGYRVLPVMLVLFIPVFFGLREIYPWARPAEVAADPVLRHRQAYENAPWYIVRTLVFFAVWIGMAMALRRWSLEQDRTADGAPTRKARTVSGPGLVLYGLTGTFASVDWIVSLEKDWKSTMFGVIFLIGQILAAYAFAVVLLTLYRRSPPLAGIVDRTQYHHLGNLLLAFVLFWTYVSFGQLLIIYSGDLPHELSWYLHRIAGSWKRVIGAVALFHFFLPFLLLLVRAIKRSIPALTTLAAVLLGMRAVDAYWLVMPSLHPLGPAPSWMDFGAILGMGALWLGCFLWQLSLAPLVPKNDPGRQFSFVYGKRIQSTT